MELNDTVKKDLIDALVTPELYRLPSNVLLAIDNKVYPLKVRPNYEDTPITAYDKLDRIDDVRQANLPHLIGKFIIVTHQHFNMRGNEIIKSLIKEGY